VKSESVIIVHEGHNYRHISTTCCLISSSCRDGTTSVVTVLAAAADLGLISALGFREAAAAATVSFML
jgi:hypothetical protein